MTERTPASLYAAELVKPPPPGKPYSVALPGTAVEGRTPIYRHWKFTDQLLVTLDPELTTMHQIFEKTVSLVPKNNCLGQRVWDAATKTWSKYQWQSYAEVAERRKNLGSGIVELYKQAGIAGDKFGIGLWCQNRPEWQITDLAAMSQSLFTVSIYDTLGPQTTEFIINHASLACVVSSLPHIPTLLKMKHNTPDMKIIISMDPLDDGEVPGYSKKSVLDAWAKDLGVQIIYMKDVEALGKAVAHPMRAPTAEDTITINYTSGTTGNPKGVLLTHRNAVAATSCSQSTLLQTSTDVSCSYMPLAHIYQRLGEHGAFWGGAAIGYFHGNPLELVDDFKLLRPNMFSSVPRLYQRIGGVIRSNTTEKEGTLGNVMRYIVNAKLANMEGPNGTTKHAVYDRLLKRVAAATGLDRARKMVTGSAPLDPSLQKYLRAIYGNSFVQGYGLTESYAVSLCQSDGDLTAGNCGGLCPAIEGCLMDVPSMDYLSTDKPFPRGELLIRGTSRFAEYYRNEEDTKKSIIEGGWFRTGDIATVDDMGRFSIIDRVKNVLKLAQGEYVSPERLENLYLANCAYLGQGFIHGDSLQTFLVGIFGVMPDMFAPFASKVLGKRIAADDLPAIKAAAADEKVRQAVIADLLKIAQKSKLSGFERVRTLKLYLEPFSIDNELLTPTLKLKRPQTARYFRADIDNLYAEALEAEKAAGKTPTMKL